MAKIIKFSEIPLEDVELLLIDIDDTLYQYDPCHLEAMNCCYDVVSEDARYPKEHLKDFKELYVKARKQVTKALYPQGACRSRLIAFMNMFERLNIVSPYSMALDYDKLYWDTFINSMRLEQDALKLLREAHRRCIKIIAITDMLTDIQIKKIEKLNIKKYIHAIVTSEEAGSEKPSMHIFALALLKAGVCSAKTIMVGDNEKKDGIGAENSGIRFFKVTTIDDV